MIYAKPVKKRYPFFTKIERSVPVNESSPITIGITAKTGIVIDLGKWIDTLAKRHVFIDYSGKSTWKYGYPYRAVIWNTSNFNRLQNVFMDQQIINLYDDYTHQPLTRQEFLRRLVLLTGSTTAAMALLPMLEVNYAHAAITPQDGLFTEHITFKGANTDMAAYVARPANDVKYPAVIVIHENRGLNAHIEDVARRAAKAGFLAIAPNALSPLGGTPPNEDSARTLFTQLKPDETLQIFIKVFDYLPGRKDFNGKAGCVGFCWGGGIANELAVNVPSLKAAVAFYGRQPDPANVPKIKAAVQLHYGALDERVNAGIPVYEEALKKANIPYELYVYEGANHAFHNDTAPTRYNEQAAKLAWKRTIDFFNKYLR